MVSKKCVPNKKPHPSLSEVSLNYKKLAFTRIPNYAWHRTPPLIQEKVDKKRRWSGNEAKSSVQTFSAEAKTVTSQDTDVQGAASVLLHISSMTLERQQRHIPPKNTLQQMNTHCPNLPKSLFHPEDSAQLNMLHCFVRSNLTELFEVVAANDGSGHACCEENDSSDDQDEFDQAVFLEDTNTNQSSFHSLAEKITQKGGEDRKVTSKRRNTRSSGEFGKHFPGRVGIRCVYCKHIRRRRDRAHQASVFPISVNGIYRQVCMWQRVHFKNCPHVPTHIKDEYDALKAVDNTRGGSFSNLCLTDILDYLCIFHIFQY